MHVPGRERTGRGSTSKFNELEAHYAAFFVYKLCCEVRSKEKPGHIASLSGRIAIITGYKSQVDKIRSAFVTWFGDAILEHVSINTVDSYQGQEKDIVILSCVRTSEIGFLADHRRMNVAITRARHQLVVLGSFDLLKKQTHWNHLLQYAREHGRIMENPPALQYNKADDVSNIYLAPGLTREEARAVLDRRAPDVNDIVMDVYRQARGGAPHPRNKHRGRADNRHSTAAGRTERHSTVSAPRPPQAHAPLPFVVVHERPVDPRIARGGGQGTVTAPARDAAAVSRLPSSSQALGPGRPLQQGPQPGPQQPSAVQRPPVRPPARNPSAVAPPQDPRGIARPPQRAATEHIRWGGSVQGAPAHTPAHVAPPPPAAAQGGGPPAPSVWTARPGAAAGALPRRPAPAPPRPTTTSAAVPPRRPPPRPRPPGQRPAQTLTWEQPSGVRGDGATSGGHVADEFHSLPPASRSSLFDPSDMPESQQ